MAASVLAEISLCLPFPRPQTARESPEEAKARRVGLPTGKVATAGSGRLAKPAPAAAQQRNNDASARILGRTASISSMNSDGSLNSARSARAAPASSFGKAGRWN